MKKFLAARVIILFVLFIILIGAFIFMQSTQKNSEQVHYTHSFTKAICDVENFCGDYEVLCKNKEIVGIKLTGATIQFPLDWKDPRSEESRNKTC